MRHLDGLTDQHRSALKWFADRAGSETAWPEQLPDETFLVTKAKGIYKPQWSTYALSVRQTLNSPYADRAPSVRPDGSWSYDYAQENLDPTRRDDEATDRGLMACLRDQVPIGVLIQTKPKPGVKYDVLGLAMVTDWNNGFFRLDSRPLLESTVEALTEPIATAAETHLGNDHAFDPSSVTDGRERAITAIVRRRGQPQFRQALIDAYAGRCTVTGYDAISALEAAHITPYRGPETNHPANGLLLRADLHTLFDLGLVYIDAALRFRLTPPLYASTYADLDGITLRLPEDLGQHPSSDALAAHRGWVLSR